jgi:hypothetical protein
MGALERSSAPGIDKRAHSPDRTRAGPACTDFGTDRLASPDDGTERLASPDDRTDRLTSPDDGTERLASPDDRIDRLASRQLGMITRAQLRQLGLTRSAIHVRVRARRLHIVHRGVYRVGPAPVDITTHRDCRRRQGIQVHRTELRQDEVTSVAVSAPLSSFVPPARRNGSAPLAPHALRAISDPIPSFSL